jgi:hypothetical protein
LFESQAPLEPPPRLKSPPVPTVPAPSEPLSEAVALETPQS